MTSQTPSFNLSYGMPDCPACKKSGLMLTHKDYVACLYCDYKRDFSKPLKKNRKKTPDPVWFLLVLIGFAFFVLISSGG